MSMENNLFPKIFKKSPATKKQRDNFGLSKNNVLPWIWSDLNSKLSELETGFMGEVERYIRINYSGGYSEPKVRINFARLKDFLKNAEKYIVLNLGLNSFSNAIAGYGGYYVLEKVRRSAYDKMAYVCINEFVQLRGDGKEKEYEEIKKTKIEMLDLFVNLVEDYLEKKEQEKLFLHTEYLSKPPNEAFKPLLYNTIKSFRFVIDDYPDFVRNNLDTDKASDIFLKLIKNRELDKSFDFRLIVTLTDLIGAGEALKKINDLIVENRKEGNKEVIDNLERARAYLVPVKNKEVFAELESFYRKFSIKKHDINEKVNAREVDLLKEMIPRGSKILESGCGTGRLLLALKNTGYDICGYDLLPENVNEVLKENPEADVSVDDWYHTKYPDEKFDAVYSLGRNILHEYSLPGQVQLFREAARILKKGGKFIFDIPDREKGIYAENIKAYKEAMNKEGIYNIREGTVYDSPNGEHFSTRYCYSHEDIQNLAQLTGFKIIEVRCEELPTGKGDENLYYVLEKI